MNKYTMQFGSNFNANTNNTNNMQSRGNSNDLDAFQVQFIRALFRVKLYTSMGDWEKMSGLKLPQCQDNFLFKLRPLGNLVMSVLPSVFT